MIMYDFIEIECTECKAVFESWAEERHHECPTGTPLKVKGYWRENGEKILVGEELA